MQEHIQYQFGLDSELVTSRTNPDSYTPEAGRPQGDFVVARDEDQTTVSVYGDDAWDWSAYHPFAHTFVLDFSRWNKAETTELATQITEEMKWLMFVVIWIDKGRRKSPPTVALYLRVISKMAEYSVEESIALPEFLQDEDRVYSFLHRYGDFYAVTTYSLLNILSKLPSEVTGYRSLSSKAMGIIGKISKRYYQNHNQHPPVPTRILSILLERVSTALSEFREHSNEIIELAGKLAENKRYGVSRQFQYQRLREDGVTGILKDHLLPTFHECVEDLQVRDYLARFGIDRRDRLFNHLNDVLFLAKLSILAYSGMRHIEATNLKYDCLETFVHHNKKHYLVKGRTTKLNHGVAKETKWVTSSEGVLAVNVARSIALFTYQHLMVFDGTTDSVKPLLLLPPMRGCIDDTEKYLSEPKRLHSAQRGRAVRSQLTSSRPGSVLSGLLIPITEDDIRELEQIDYHRDWRSEDKFKVGKPWPLAAHQLRRSLALYATNSGLVSLPSLRKQLQHIADEMSVYYARGSSFAKDILKADSDFSGEYATTLPESEALSYIQNVLLSDEKLFGAHGAWLSTRQKKEGSIILDNREETLEKFRSGQIHYKETVLGGCTGTRHCLERATRSVVACVECSGGLIVPSKLNRVIRSQQAVLEAMEPGTLAYRTEEDDLNKLLNIQEKIEASESGA